MGMTDSQVPVSPRSGVTALIVALAGTKLLIHLYTNAFAGYGIFRDELYYLACADHLGAGYVDQPPLSIWVLAAARALLGDSIFALRLLPALSGAATVWVICSITRELGGGRFAVLAAGLASIVSLIMLGMSTVYSMNAFDFLFWGITAWLMLRLIRDKRPVLWIWIGVVLGLAALNKIGNLWLGLGVYLGVLLSPERRQLRGWHPWAGGCIAALLFLPYVYWNLAHDLAHLEFIRNATGGKYSGLTRASFLAYQPLLQNPVTVPVWLAGLWFYFAARACRSWRPLGMLFVTALAVLLANAHSKPEYLATAYVPLFAAGGVMLEKWLARERLRMFRVPLLISLACGIVLAPMVLPILPVETYVRYAGALGIQPGSFESKKLDKLPQFYADMFGWEQKARDVAAVYHGLTLEEKARCAIFGDNYGRCGAIDYFGPVLGLPKSIGRHNNYWIWGPRNYTGEVVIVLGGDLEDKQRSFASVEVAATSSCQYCMPYENSLKIYICRGLKVPLQRLWPRLKNFS